MNPEHILSASAYKNYRNVRAVSLLYVVLGGFLALGGFSMFGEGGARSGEDRLMGVALALIGLAGVVGGFATLAGNRNWAPLVKVMAWIYLLAFPIGTILSYALLTGHRQYLHSIDQINRGEADPDEMTRDDDW